MRGSAARNVANIVIATAAVGAAYVVITTPPLRRLALIAVRIWLGATVPAYLAREIHTAWVESARAA